MENNNNNVSADSTSLEHEIDCSNFFDHIEDLLLDFPQDNNVFVGSRGDSFPAAWNGSCFDPDSVFIGNRTRCSPDLAAELSLPYEDVVQMEWLSNFMEESFSGGNSIMTLDKQQFPSTKDVTLAPVQFQSLSPISVLESSSSSSSSNSPTDDVGKVLPLGADNSVSIRGRARSKRPRPPTFNPESAMQLISPAQSFTESENFNESNHLTKAKKRKPKASCSVEMSHKADPVTSESQAGFRKCLHCEITKTPQWRAGPMGPKTLCNACGVRHKSGRLFPEYRPAASPTFVPSMHSNSHKKVLEMRTTTVDIPANTTAYDAQPEFIPNKNAMLELEYI